MQPWEKQKNKNNKQTTRHLYFLTPMYMNKEKLIRETHQTASKMSKRNNYQSTEKEALWLCLLKKFF